MRWIRGMTMAELLSLAVVSVALLAAFSPRIAHRLPRDPETRLRVILAEVRNAILVFYHDTGLYPVDLSDLTATEPPRIGLDRWGRPSALNPDYYRGPYLSEVPKCPVSGEELEYYCDPRTGAMQVRSPAKGMGGNGRPYREW
ncbi:MAG: type II secretion system GspH family protein [Fimbriimonadales bacterium]|nr:type II secretion system GspH family protein [Fimbriimonadales bacterium]